MPRYSATPHERRKLYILGAFAGVIIILFWVSTLPLNLRDSGSAAGPTSLFTRINEQLSHGMNAFIERGR